MNQLVTRLRQLRNQRHRYRYIITNSIAGQPTKYFTWDANLVWRWTPNPRKASRFTSEQTAILCAESTSMSDWDRYTVRRIPR